MSPRRYAPGRGVNRKIGGTALAGEPILPVYAASARAWQGSDDSIGVCTHVFRRKIWQHRKTIRKVNRYRRSLIVAWSASGNPARNTVRHQPQTSWRALTKSGLRHTTAAPTTPAWRT